MGVEILVGDALAVLSTLPSESVNCCVTSPPYWGLRDYQCEGQLGLEKSPEEYVTRMVEVFREARRVLDNSGTLWLNLGDSYATGAGAVGSCPGGGKQGDAWNGHRGSRGGSAKQPHTGAAIGPSTQPNRMPIAGLKPKDLVGIPWRVAFALQADGWYLRSDIIWHKPNPMTESVKDRPTKSHEYFFLMTKAERYFYDADAIAEPVSESMLKQVEEGYEGHSTKLFEMSGAQDASATKSRIINGARKKLTGGKWSSEDTQSSGHRLVEAVANARANGGSHDSPFGLTRNKRTVWTVNTAPYREGHFATFPPDLIKPCILAGCPVGGVVLDPFAGSGTTGMVALELGRNAVLIELNPTYAELIKQRTNITPGLAL